MDIDNKIIEVIEQQENVIKEIYSKAQNEIAYYNGLILKIRPTANLTVI